MDILLLGKAAIMGVVEGLTEFLPISSTGHLILTASLLNFTGDKVKVFDIAIQTGAIFAVILVYWQRLRDTAAGLGSDPRARRFTCNVLIAFVPAVLLGLLFGKAIKAHLFNPTVVAAAFIAGGFVILWAEHRPDQLRWFRHQGGQLLSHRRRPTTRNQRCSPEENQHSQDARQA